MSASGRARFCWAFILQPRGAAAGPRRSSSVDVTPELTDLIVRDRSVLVVGESTAGKSRVLDEATRALLPDHWLVGLCCGLMISSGFWGPTG